MPKTEVISSGEDEDIWDYKSTQKKSTPTQWERTQTWANSQTDGKRVNVKKEKKTKIKDSQGRLSATAKLKKAKLYTKNNTCRYSTSLSSDSKAEKAFSPGSQSGQIKNRCNIGLSMIRSINSDTNLSVKKPAKSKTVTSTIKSDTSRSIKSEMTPNTKKNYNRDGRCPVCQMPFRALSCVQTPSWHVDECLDQPCSSKDECPAGTMCDINIVGHYKRYRHTLLYRSRKKNSSPNHLTQPFGNVANAKVRLDFDGETQKTKPEMPPEQSHCIIDLDSSPTASTSYSQSSDGDLVDEDADSETQLCVQNINFGKTQYSEIDEMFEDISETTIDKEKTKKALVDKNETLTVDLHLKNKTVKRENINFSKTGKQRLEENRNTINKYRHGFISNGNDDEYVSVSDEDLINNSCTNSKHKKKGIDKLNHTAVDEDAEEVLTKIESSEVAVGSQTNSIHDIYDMDDNSRTVSDMIMDALADSEEEKYYSEKGKGVEQSLKDILSPESDSSDDWEILKNTLTQPTVFTEFCSPDGRQKDQSHGLLKMSGSSFMDVTEAKVDYESVVCSSFRSGNQFGVVLDADSKDSSKGFFARKSEEKDNNKAKKEQKVIDANENNPLYTLSKQIQRINKTEIDVNSDHKFNLNKDKFEHKTNSLKRRHEVNETVYDAKKMSSTKCSSVTGSFQSRDDKKCNDLENSAITVKREVTLPHVGKRSLAKLSGKSLKQNKKSMKENVKKSVNNQMSVMSFFKPVVKKEESNVETISIKTETSDSDDGKKTDTTTVKSKYCCMDCGRSESRQKTSLGYFCPIQTSIKECTCSPMIGKDYGYVSIPVPNDTAHFETKTIDTCSGVASSPDGHSENITPKFQIENNCSVVLDVSADLAGVFFPENESNNKDNSENFINEEHNIYKPDLNEGENESEAICGTDNRINKVSNILNDHDDVTETGIEAATFMQTVKEKVSLIRSNAADILMASSRLLYSKTSNPNTLKSKSDTKSQSNTRVRPANALTERTNQINNQSLSRGTGSRNGGSSSWNEPNVQTNKKACPFYKKIPGTYFTVDAFKYGDIPDCRAYILSHYHYDHYIGLTKNFSQPIYCSQITGNLVRSKSRVDQKYIHALPLDTPTVIHDVQVTFLEANHCPGSVLILFKLKSGKVYLHTGDFRACEAMEMYPALQNVKIHALYLDTTYCDPQYAFPPQEQVVKFGVKLVTHALTCNPKTLVVCGAYTIGKERIFTAIAEALSCKICVTREKKSILDNLEDAGLKEKISLNWNDSQLHVLPMNKLNYKGLQEHLLQNGRKYNCILGIEPTGWTFSKKLVSLDHIKPKLNKDNITVYGIPYSEHSSFLEMKRFVQFTKPDKILPTVNNGNVHSRRKMDVIFDNWMK